MAGRRGLFPLVPRRDLALAAVAGALLLVFLAGCGLGPRVERGTLEGHATIVPAPGQVSAAPAPTAPPDLYQGRSIILYLADGRTLVTNVLLDAQGNFRVNLDPGSYVVKWRRHGVERATNLPAPVVIESGKTVRLDIQVEEGIE